MTATYITTTIPYVNARPHLGFALELVHADVLARYHRSRGEQVRFQAGTDDNSLKNVLAAQAAGMGVQEFVDASAAAFCGLAEPLSLSVDDLIRTSSDPRHRTGVERLWRACAARGDLYRKHYEGLYCTGCEQFYTTAELAGGQCPDHGTVPELVSEENWFFRLSRYAGQLRGLIAGGTIRIEPAERRNEVLALIDGGLADFSVSRAAVRARGWGIPVPGDPGQVIYVWWDALGNYLTALDYASGGAALGRWWTGASRRIHLLGKGVLRFHAVYWPAMLLSAGEAVPTDIVVHGYLTANGRKISKSGGATVDPYDLARDFGTDAVRWWLLREVPRGADADFTAARLVSRANDELANGLGNLANRVVTMIHRYRDGRVPATTAPAPGAAALDRAIAGAPGLIAAALGDFDFRGATEAVWQIAGEANRYVNRTRPWDLAKAGDPAELDAVLAALLAACRAVGTRLAPFLPDAAARITGQCAAGGGGVLPRPAPLLPRIAPPVPAPGAGARRSDGRVVAGPHGRRGRRPPPGEPERRISAPPARPGEQQGREQADQVGIQLPADLLRGDEEPGRVADGRDGDDHLGEQADRRRDGQQAQRDRDAAEELQDPGHVGERVRGREADGGEEGRRAGDAGTPEPAEQLLAAVRDEGDGQRGPHYQGGGIDRVPAGVNCPQGPASRIQHRFPSGRKFPYNT
jgi:methionyl-tRNA synthetase